MSRMIRRKRLSPTMISNGQMWSDQNSAIIKPLFRSRHACASLRDRRTFRHHRRTAGDGVGEIEIVDAGAERRLIGVAAAGGELLHIRRIAGRDLTDALEVRILLE